MNQILLRTALIASLVIFGPCISTEACARENKKSTRSTKSACRFKKVITVVNNGGEIVNAVIKIHLDSTGFDYPKAKAGGADLRFSAGKTLKGSGMCYWIEKWNDNGNAIIWLKIPILKANEKLKLQMYYGNTTAEPVSSGANTFLFFDDFESGDYTKNWTDVSIGQVAEQDGVLKLKEADGEDGIITANFTISGKMVIRTLYQRGNADEHWTRAGIGGWDAFLCFGDHTDFAGTGTNYVKITDKWRPAAFWYDGKDLSGMQDDVIVKWPIADASSKLSLRTLDNDAWDNFAFITVSPFSNGKQEVSIGAEAKN